jgi:hypothetical protein
MTRFLCLFIALLWSSLASAQGINNPSAPVISKAGTATRDLTVASGTQAITGMGFKPSTCFFNGTTSGALGAYTTLFGFSSSTTAGAVLAYAGTTLITTVINTVLIANDATNANGQTAVMTSYDTDGFTLTWTKNSVPTGTFTFNYLCYK